MWLSQVIQFPNMGIRIEHLMDSFLVFGNIRITMYGILIGIGIVAGFLVVQWQALRTGQDRELYLDFALYAVIFSLIGARLYYVIFSWEEFQADPIQIWNIRGGGMAIYGGILAAILTGIIYCRIKKVSFWRLADTACLGLVTGQIIGRWGNFFNREAFGGYTDNLFAMRLSVQDVIPSSITEEMLRFAEQDGYPGFIQVHPTFLYESIWNLVLLLVLIVCTRWKKFDGELFLIYLTGYGIGRVWIEGLRTDQLYLWGTELPVSALLSIVLAVSAFLLLLLKRRAVRKKKDGY